MRIDQYYLVDRDDAATRVISIPRQYFIDVHKLKINAVHFAFRKAFHFNQVIKTDVIVKLSLT